MPLNPTDSTTSSTPTVMDTAKPKDPTILGKDDFLRLLIGQMQNQDPLNPTDSAQYMQQMTQFSILEQITNLGQTTSAAASNEYDQNAIALIGKEITYLRTGADGKITTASGRVESVKFTSAGPQLSITGDSSPVMPVSVLNVWGEGGAPRVPPPADPDPGSEQSTDPTARTGE
ncbi:flagellar hook capping FlgD N-terminal domain-containing protein [Conexibacter sp. JD483]|uniref:flagellar hook capping FlgD N-terminal domain-containing protein n=1 Tax=unclassified Conexibacter TaxID=2627773 RepID=UPI002715B4F5|nr:MULTISPECIES: flagellar hook capping FlgD N-terminal domain-containing protein [unclassified Conexibacter]MDO8188198.1 flagellar hook capping FlgD N-terminal domain-containing protein [Conexibacter sp. CPCC 205706]MDO8201838.1 flagellar hook capping FlgD N-terminal domain-containing protein [Conexibacter sp. CPCC 205762]MDR9372897.1 flagellar hook capping FlgD N-terminal domain-containing protein [Conexibacter sp. JD483]